MVFCSVIAFVVVRVLKLVKGVNMPRRDYLRRVMPIGALYAASLWLSNSAYLHLSVSFIQMTKALMPGLVYMTARAASPLPPRPRVTPSQGVYMGTEQFTGSVAAIMVFIAIGVAIAAYGEVNFVVIGVVEQLSALVFEAMRLMLVQVLMNSQGCANGGRGSGEGAGEGCPFREGQGVLACDWRWQPLSSRSRRTPATR